MRPTPTLTFSHPLAATALFVVEIGRIFWLRTDKCNAHGFAPVSLRLTARGCPKAELSTGVRCRPADWAGPAGRPGPLKRSHLDYGPDSDALEALARNVRVAQRRLEALGVLVTPSAVVALLKNPTALHPTTPPCLLEFMEAELETHYRRGNRATYEAARAVVRKLRAWHGPGRLPVEALPPARGQAFYRHLLAATARGGEIATANKALAWLTALYRRGVKQSQWAADNPFAAIDKKAALKRGKVRLTAAELAAVLALALPAGWLSRARQVFRLQFYLRGERIGACLLLRWEQVRQHDTCVRYQAQKNGPHKQVPVRPELAALLHELVPRRAAGHVFVLPYLPDDYDKLDARQQLGAVKDATALINKALKEVARRAGVDKPLRSHAARHTFATVAGKAVGARAVQQLLGHTTLKMTETYLAELDHDELDEAAAAAFDSLALEPPPPAPPPVPTARVRYHSVEQRRGLPLAPHLAYTPMMLHTGRVVGLLPH